MEEASERLIPSSKDTHDSLKPPSIARQHYIDPAFRQCQWWYRLLLLITSFFATWISIGIGFLYYHNYTTGEKLFELVQSNRSTVQVLIQVISHTLGALSVFSLCAILNYWSRSALFKRDRSLNSLRLWSALCFPSIGWNLRLLPKIATIALWALCVDSIRHLDRCFNASTDDADPGCHSCNSAGWTWIILFSSPAR